MNNPQASEIDAAKKALIIGISGQDGSYLAQALLSKGYKVYGTSRDAGISPFTNLDHLKIKDKVTLSSMSLTDFRSVIQVLNTVEPDEIYNLAGQSSVGLSFDQPVETYESISIGTLNLLEALRFFNSPSRLYNASSSECFGNITNQPATEETAFRPRSPYAVAKASAFWTVSNYREAYGIYACSGILFNHESPLRPERFVTRKIVSAACRIANGSQDYLKLGNIDIQRDWGWAPEYVEAMWIMLQQEQPEDFIIATGKTSSLKDFIRIVFSQLGLNWADHVLAQPELLRPTDIMISSGNPLKVKKLLGWQACYSVEDVANMMVEAELADKRL